MIGMNVWGAIILPSRMGTAGPKMVILVRMIHSIIVAGATHIILRQDVIIMSFMTGLSVTGDARAVPL